MKIKTLHYLTSAAALLSCIILGASLLPGLDWARFERTSAIGPIEYRLNADFDAVGFEYSLRTAPSSSGGGIIGGLGGGVGTNISRDEEWKTYPEVRGEVLENLGVLYDSYKEKSYIYELLFKTPPEEANITWTGSGSPSAYLNVSLKADLVPFWPEGSTRPMRVAVTFTGTDLDDQVPPGSRSAFSITLEKMTIKARTGYDAITGEYEGETLTVGEKELSEKFAEAGDSYSTTMNVAFPEGSDAAGFVVEIVAHMTDYWGRSERSPLPGMANPINIRPVSTPLIIRGIGIPLALPLLGAAVLISLAGAALTLIFRRSYYGLFIPPVLLSFTGIIWFRTGMGAAVELLGKRLSGAEEGLGWGPGMYIALAGSVLLAVVLASSIISHIMAGRQSGKRAHPADGAGAPLFRRVEDEGEGSSSRGERSARVGPPSSLPPPPRDPLG